MLLRTACFVGAISVGSGYLRWVLVTAALVLPYVAVVVANSEGTRTPGSDLLGPTPTHRELG